MRPTRRRARRGAFTLIEVLVSLGIFALAAVVLGTAYVNVLLNYHLMRQHGTERSELAMARADLLAEPDRARVERGGEVALAEGGSVRWEARVEETEVADLFQVELAWEIAPADRTPARREKETFLLLRPTWSEPDQREQLRAASKARLLERRF